MVFGKLFAGLKKTRERLSSGLSRLFTMGRKLDEDFLDELEEVLYTADLGPTGSDLVELAQQRNDFEPVAIYAPLVHGPEVVRGDATLRIIDACVSQ